MVLIAQTNVLQNLLMYKILQNLRMMKFRMFYSIFYFISFYLYIYPPDSQESDGGTNTMGKQLPRPASGNAKILLSACNLMEILL